MLRTITFSFWLAFLVDVGLAQSPDPPLADERLSVHTLLREDIFAGFRANNMERLERGEKNIDWLMQQRPQAKADLLAWKGGVKLYRSVLAHEADDEVTFQRLHKESQVAFTEARELGPKNAAAAAVVGGSYALFADRLPEKHREAAWSDCFDSYQVLWSQQAPYVEKLPIHIRGELLAGLIQSSQRTGRKDELSKYLDKMIEVLPDTSYSRLAQRWKDDPQAAVGSSIACKSCHAQGRLKTQIKRLDGN